MVTLKYLLEVVGFGLLAAGAALLILDYRRDVAGVRWRLAARVAAAGLLPLLLGISIVVVPAGMAGVRVSQVSGTMPGTVYPGLHLVLPLVQSVALYDMRDQLFQTTLGEKATESLKVQTREGLSVGLAVAVRYRIDSQPAGVHTYESSAAGGSGAGAARGGRHLPGDCTELPGAGPVRGAPRRNSARGRGGDHS